MKITALYCVKNEQEFLAKSVFSVLDFVDEVVIINNLSTDGTGDEMARLHNGYPKKVKLVDMDSDFDATCEFNMRNKALEFVSADTAWIIALDGDQILSDGWFAHIFPVIGSGKYEVVGIWSEHLVGSYEYLDKAFYEKQKNPELHPNVGMIQWTFFKKTPHLRCRPASEVCSWAKPQHHASFERSCTPGMSVFCKDVRSFHYGFAKRNMMEMSLYRIHRGDYGHDPERKQQLSEELVASGNPFKFIGPVHRVGYGAEFTPESMRDKFDTTYKLELDEQGFIQRRIEL